MAKEKDASGASTKLQDLIFKLEVDAVGIASLDEWRGTKLEETALRLLPTARSIVVLAMEVYREILEQVALNKKIECALMSDLYNSHVEFIHSRVTEAVYDVAKASHGMGMRALPLPARGLPVNERLLTAVFSYKHAAQAAGLGNIGRHSLLITPKFGPRVRLAGCLTEAVLQPTTAKEIQECGDCHICIDNCPVGALATPQGDEPYHINKFACRSFTAGAGYLCSECLRLCPATGRA